MISTNSNSVDNDEIDRDQSHLSIKALNPTNTTPIHTNKKPFQFNHTYTSSIIPHLPKAPMAPVFHNVNKVNTHPTTINSNNNSQSVDSMNEIRSCIDSVHFDDDDMLRLNDDVFRKLNVPKSNKTNTLKLDMIDLKSSYNSVVKKNQKMKFKKSQIERYLNCQGNINNSS
jgi:hypothetical protein